MKNKLKTLAIAIGLATASTASYAAPQEPGVVVTVEGTKVTAYWNPVIGASEYTLFYAPFPYQGESTIGKMSMEGKTDITVDLPVGASYYVAVKSKDASGESKRSNVELFTVKTPDPADASASISDIISSTATNVVLASYEDFAVEAQGLAGALKEFQASPQMGIYKKLNSHGGIPVVRGSKQKPFYLVLLIRRELTLLWTAGPSIELILTRC